MRHLPVLVIFLAVLLVAPAASADIDWGADAYSAKKDVMNEAEVAMGRRFESYAIYSALDRPHTMQNDRVRRAIKEKALIYLNINSSITGVRGNEIPICWNKVATGHRDPQLHDWAHAIAATRYTNLVITFNHEPMWESLNQPRCSDRWDNPTTYRAAWSHVRKLFTADGVAAKWAYVMTWGATKNDNALAYRPAPRNFQVIGTDQYYACNDRVYPPAHAFESFFDWTALHARGKEVLVGEMGALTTCPDTSLQWLEAAKKRIDAHPEVLSINWNLRTDAGKEYDPLLQPDIRAWWLAWAAEESGSP